MEALDPDRIAELVDAAKEGQLPAPAAVPARRPPRVRTLDFSRPTKFSADLQRRLNRATETFCQTANTRLSSELRWPLELEIVGTVQLTWAATQSQIPPGSLLAVIEVEPAGTKLLLTIEQSLIVVCLECLLGGSPERPARDRRLSEIDWTLARGLIESLVTPLSLVWQELAGVTLRVGEIGTHESGQVASVSDPTFGTQIEARINQQSYTLGLLLPWASIEPFETTISGRMPADADPLHGGVPPLCAPMGAVPVEVRAEVAHTLMSVKDILHLAPGSVITFETPAEDGIEIYADAVRIARGRPGRSGARRAAQLTEFVEDGR